MNIKEVFIKIIAPFKRIGLENKNFTIISNNCWGGIIYRNYHIPYNSPTCGLYFFSEDYITFVSDLRYYLFLDLKQVSIYESKYSSVLLKNHGEELVIGRLNDVEIVFLHYKTFDEAKSKWIRRTNRINFDNLLVKYSDQNLFKEEHFEKFKKLAFKNKIFITVNKKYKSPYTFYIDDVDNIGYAKDDIKPSFKVINIKSILNNLQKEGD